MESLILALTLGVLAFFSLTASVLLVVPSSGVSKTQNWKGKTLRKVFSTIYACFSFVTIARAYEVLSTSYFPETYIQYCVNLLGILIIGHLNYYIFNNIRKEDVSFSHESNTSIIDDLFREL